MPTSASRPASRQRSGLGELLVAELDAGQLVGPLRVRPGQAHRHVEVVGAGGERPLEDRHHEPRVHRVEHVGGPLLPGERGDGVGVRGVDAGRREARVGDRGRRPRRRAPRRRPRRRSARRRRGGRRCGRRRSRRRPAPTTRMRTVWSPWGWSAVYEGGSATTQKTLPCGSVICCHQTPTLSRSSVTGSPTRDAPERLEVRDVCLRVGRVQVDVHPVLAGRAAPRRAAGSRPAGPAPPARGASTRNAPRSAASR